jgi:hypothetical protein
VKLREGEDRHTKKTLKENKSKFKRSGKRKNKGRRKEKVKRLGRILEEVDQENFNSGKEK